MKGLLYKEFLVIRGRIILLGTGIALLAFLMLRIAFPGANLIVREGEELSSIPVGYMYDTWLSKFALLLPVVGIAMLTPLIKLLTENGRKRKERAYTMALPLPADSAVKAKYITFAGCVVLFLCASAAMHGIYFINAGKNQATDEALLFLKLQPGLFAVVLLIGALEMFAYLGLGKRRGDALLILLLVPIALLLVWCLFFVDPATLSKLNIGRFIEFHRNHKTLVRILGALLIVASVGLYYLSFRIVRKIELNRKAEIDE